MFVGVQSRTIQFVPVVDLMEEMRLISLAIVVIVVLLVFQISFYLKFRINSFNYLDIN